MRRCWIDSEFQGARWYPSQDLAKFLMLRMLVDMDGWKAISSVTPMNQNLVLATLDLKDLVEGLPPGGRRPGRRCSSPCRRAMPKFRTRYRPWILPCGVTWTVLANCWDWGPRNGNCWGSPLRYALAADSLLI